MPEQEARTLDWRTIGASLLVLAAIAFGYFFVLPLLEVVIAFSQG